MKANLNLFWSSLIFNSCLLLPHERLCHITKISALLLQEPASAPLSLHELNFWDSGQVAKNIRMIFESLRCPNNHPKLSELPCYQASRNIKSRHNPEPITWGKLAIVKAPKWLPFSWSMYFKQDPLHLCPLNPNYNTQRGPNSKAISEQ